MPKLIIMEGPNGAGKSTLVTLLGSWTTALAFREPGGTPFGEAVRQVVKMKGTGLQLETQVDLFLAARRELFETFSAHLKVGASIVLDRSAVSTLVYQTFLQCDPGKLRSDLQQRILDHFAACVRDLPEGTEVHLVHVLPPASSEGRSKRDGEPDAFESLNYEIECNSYSRAFFLIERALVSAGIKVRMNTLPHEAGNEEQAVSSRFKRLQEILSGK